MNLETEAVNVTKNGSDGHVDIAVGIHVCDVAVGAGLFDVAVGDVSFISQTLIAPQIAALLKPGGQALMLVKPQFELQPQHISKGGLVKNPALYAEVQAKVSARWQDLGFEVKHYIPSPIAGGDGNREFFIHAIKTT